LRQDRSVRQQLCELLPRADTNTVDRQLSVLKGGPNWRVDLDRRQARKVELLTIDWHVRDRHRSHRLNMSAARVTLGAASLSISSHFPTIWKSMNVKPVMFPPGCAKLETKPCSTGSLTAATMIGMELVACRSARVTGVVLPTIMSGASATSSAA
jgi:hypothetical protein